MPDKTTLTGEIVKGLWRDNPVLVLLLGLCPALAVTNSAYNGLGMGLATTFVLLGSNLIVSLIKKIVPKSVRIPVYIVVIATFVTTVDLLLKAYFYDLSRNLGLFVPLIVVNCIILGRAEAFAARNPVALSMADGISVGLGFTMSLGLVGSLREILGAGTWFGMSVFGDSYEPFGLMVQAPGAFLCLGILLGLMNAWSRRRGEIFIQT